MKKLNVIWRVLFAIQIITLYFYFESNEMIYLVMVNIYTAASLVIAGLIVVVEPIKKESGNEIK